MAADYIDTISEGEARTRYKQKLTVIGSDCPYRLPANVWKNNPTEWPNIQYPDIYHYLIESPGIHTREAMKNYKSLRSYNLLVSGWVQTVYHMHLQNGLFLFKTSVQRSYNLSEAPHATWASADSSGRIVTAHCTCKAGLGESCTHVGALLMKIEMVGRVGLTAEACTDKPCIWNATCTTGVCSSTIAEIQFYGDKTKRPSTKRKLSPTEVSEDAKEEYLAELLSCKELPVCLSKFSSTGGNFVSSQPVPKRIKMPPPLREANMLPDKKQAIVICEEEANYVEKMTRGQHTSMSWHDQRAGRITSCRAHSVKTSRQEHPVNLIKRICSNRAVNLNTVPINWGREHEKDGFVAYVDEMQTKHENFQARDSGLYIDQARSYIAASPDGVVHCKCCGHGVIEIKCPHKFRFIDPSLIEGYSIGADGKLKPNHEHYTQVQHHLLVTKSSYCDYVIWTTIDKSITRVYPDHDLHNALLSKYALFWEKHLRPELMSGTLEKAAEIKEDNKENEAVHCSCGFKDQVPMVGCDGDNCPHEWYHYVCVGLKKAPTKDTWYCPCCIGKDRK